MSREKKLVVDRTDLLKFQDLDTDKNGSISQKEILDRFDEDRNGEISKKEYNSYNVSQKKKKRKSKHRRHGHGVNWYLWNVYKTTQLLSIPVFLLFYGLFYSVTTSVVLDSGLNENMNMFYLQELVKDRLIEQTFTDSDGEHGAMFGDIHNAADLWIWVESVFVPYVAPASKTFEIQQAYDTFDTKPVTIDGLLTLPYPPLFVQLRSDSPYLAVSQPKTDTWSMERFVKNKTCSASLTDGAGCDMCTPYSYHFDPKNTSTTQSKSCGCEEWSEGTFKFTEPNHAPRLMGKDGKYYDTKGYILSLPISDGTEVSDLGSVDNVLGYQSFCSAQRLMFMAKNSWMDKSTRILSLSFCAVPFTSMTETTPAMDRAAEASICFRAVFDIDRYGLVTPSYDTYVGQAYLKVERMNGLETLFIFTTVVFPIYFLISEIIEIMIRRKRYCKAEEAIWNWFDLGVASLCLVFGLSFSIDPFHNIDSSNVDAMFMTIKALMNNRSWLRYAGVIMFASTIKIIKIVSLGSYDSKLPILTIFRSMWDSLPFLIFLLLWMFGLGMFCNLSFGAMIPSFRSVLSSQLAILKMLLGEVDFDQYEGTSIYIEAPVIISLFAIMTLYFILTMFVSIIDNAYHVTQEALEKEKEARRLRSLDDYEVVDWWGSLLHKSLLKKSKFYRTIHRIEHVVAEDIVKVVDAVESNYILPTAESNYDLPTNEDVEAGGVESEEKTQSIN
jgi:hypothetical protein